MTFNVFWNESRALIAPDFLNSEPALNNYALVSFNLT